MGRPEYTQNESYVSELDQPYEGKPIDITGGLKAYEVYMV